MIFYVTSVSYLIFYLYNNYLLILHLHLLILQLLTYFLCTFFIFKHFTEISFKNAILSHRTFIRYQSYLSYLLSTNFSQIAKYLIFIMFHGNT